MDNQNIFSAGVAEKNISPDKPELLKLVWGRKVARGINTPIKVKALVLTDGETKSVILTADQIGTSENRAKLVKEAVASKIKCSPDNIMFSAAHAHLSMCEESYDSAESQEAFKEYQKKVEDGFIQVIIEADKNLASAEIAGGRALLAEPVGKSRRMQLSTGACQTAWGAGAVALPGVKMVGPSNHHPDTIDFACLRRPGKETPLAFLTGYGSHIHLYQIPYFCGETGGAIQAELEARIPGLTALYAYSTGGNIDMNGVYPRPDRENEEEILAWYNDSLKLQSGRFADAIEKALPEIRYDKPERIAHRYFSEDLDRPENLRTPRPLSRKLVLHALALGNVAIVNMPGEFFNEYSEDLHSKSPFEHLVITAHNECNLGYIGAPVSYEKGGYEIKGVVPLDAENEQELRKQKIRINAANPETGTTIINKVAGLLEQVNSEDHNV